MYCIEFITHTGRTEAIYGPYTEEQAEAKATQLRQQESEEGDKRAPNRFQVRRMLTY